MCATCLTQLTLLSFINLNDINKFFIKADQYFVPYDNTFILPVAVMQKTLAPALIFLPRLGNNYRQLFSRITPTL